MSADKPDLSRRRTMAVPSPDEGIDPIDLHPSKKAPEYDAKDAVTITQRATTKNALSTPKAAPKRSESTRDLNCEVTATVMETIDFAKFKTKLSKREIVQQAILHYWSEYVPNNGNE